MTIDAQQWVWNESRAKGNPRLVLLAVADKAPDAQCTVRMGTTELRARLGGVSKSVVVRAVDAALASGELRMVEEARGSRAATYQLPYAVGYVRPSRRPTGPESGPVTGAQGYRIETGSTNEGSRIETPTETATGPESGPGGYRIETPTGPESGPLYQTTPTRSASKPEGPQPPDPIPTNCRPLVDALTTAGVLVRWNLAPAEWLTLDALIKRSGINALAAFAQKQAANRDISYARYFLAGWKDLPPLPEPGTTRPQLRAVAGGWQPYQNPTDPSVYENGF